MTVLDRVEGSSAWGAGTLAAGDGSRQPSATELSIAEFQVSELPRVMLMNLHANRCSCLQCI